MSSNGVRRPPRPRLEIAGGPASDAEAAAIAAAIEQFLAETAPRPEPGPRQSPWQRAALIEGVGAKQAVISPWER